MRIVRDLVVFVSLLVSATCSAAQSVDSDESIWLESNLVYAEGKIRRGSKSLLMDIYQLHEPCETLKPLVLIIHGGAFVRGSKTESQWDERARDAARRGYVAAAINYRLIPDRPVISEEFKQVRAGLIEAKADLPSNTRSLKTYANGITASIEDTVTALRFLASNAPQDRCIDMTRIGLWGGSAGAIATMHVAYGLDDYGITFPQPDVVIDYWGMMFQDGMMRDQDPPLFILHGGQDERVATQGALDLKDQADAVGVNAALYVVVGAGHGYSGIRLRSRHQSVNGVPLLALTMNFLDAHLKDDAPAPVYETVLIE
jgi:acetyl esterase/lipase